MTDIDLTADAQKLRAIAKERLMADAEFHAKVHQTLQVMCHLGVVSSNPSDQQERAVNDAAVEAAAIALLIPVGEPKRMAVITPSDHYFRQWQRIHPEYEGVAITSVQEARGQLFDSYVCYDPALRMSPGEVGPRVMAVRNALKPR